MGQYLVKLDGHIYKRFSVICRSMYLPIVMYCEVSCCKVQCFTSN